MKISNKLLIPIIVCTMSCQDENVVITRDYIYNENWGTKQSYGVDIYQIELSDSVQGLINEGVSNMIILRDHKKSDSFAYYLDGPEDLKSFNNKVYFSRVQKGLHWTSHVNYDIKVQKLGRLKTRTWYLLERLKVGWDYYVYVDSAGNVNVYPVMPHNW